ncbi:MAG: hypothetical protein U9P68_04000 [Pseudomonadota bacterium]|nr:hypothetical protein [Pseudomonadota bacterium]
MLEKDPKTRRDRVDWYPYLIRAEAGESQAALARQAGVDPSTLCRKCKVFAAMPPAEREALRQRAFQRRIAKIEAQALDGEIDKACKDARGLETVRRLLDAVEDEMRQQDDRPAAGARHDDITPDAARAELLLRLDAGGKQRQTKALGQRSDGRAGGGILPGVAALETKRGPDTP